MSQQIPNNIPSILNELDKIIYGQRTTALSPIEINKLFQIPITPEFNLILYRAFERKALSPDIVILQAIPQARSKDYLIPIALCLRFGADANMYVNAPSLGTIHILGYIYNILGNSRFSDIIITDENILNTIVLMMIIKGSRPSMSIYDKKAGQIGNDNISDRALYRSQSLAVVEWLNIQGYDTILDRINVGNINELEQFVDGESLTVLSILLDMPSVLGRNYESQDILLAIRSFSPITFEKIPTPVTIVMMDYKSLDDCVTYLNSMAFDSLIKRGQVPSYILINKILIGMRGYRNLGFIAPVQELERMLLSSISIGVQLDQDQLNIISVMGRDILEAVLKEYEQPYWRKICRNTKNNSETPDALKRLAISLNIDPNLNKAAICSNIDSLSKVDKESLKNAARRRQQLRLDSNTGYMNEFLDGKVPNLVCRNKSLLPHDPLDYNDVDLAYYRDDQNVNWCFGSDSFSDLIETGINPYNSTSLPPTFIDGLKHQLEVLRKLGINADHGEIGIYSSRVPITFSESIDSLTAKDLISEKNSEKSVNLFIQLANNYGISSETIRILSKDRMMNALRSINYNVNLTPLTTSHALITTARIINYINRTNPDLIRLFFESLNTGQTF